MSFGAGDVFAVMTLVSQLRGIERGGLRRFPPAEYPFLKVFDLNRDDDSAMQQQIQTADPLGPAMAFRDSISNSLRVLPNPTLGNIRIYIEHDFDQVEYYKEHFNHLKGLNTQLHYGKPSQRGYEALAAQWRSLKPKLWCDAYLFLIRKDHTGSSTLRRLFSSIIGDAESFAKSLIQTVKQVCILEDDSGNLTS